VEIEWAGRLRAEEYLRGDLERLSAGRPVARAGLVTDTTVSLGIAVRASPTLQALCQERGWPILPRTTGGSGLLHRPGDLLWSVVLPRDDPRVGRGFVRSYGRYGGPMVAALNRAGINAAWVPAFDLSDRYCLFGGRGEVLGVGDRALGGAAQQLTARGLLHHGVVGSDLDRAALARLFEVAPALLAERLTSFRESGGSEDLEAIGRHALDLWASDPEAPRVDGRT
jgi:lipoate-protein ligase A